MRPLFPRQVCGELGRVLGNGAVALSEEYFYRGYLTLQRLDSRLLEPHLPAQIFYPDGNRDCFVKVLKANLGMFSLDGRMPADGPDTVFKTVKVADPKTDWSSVELKRTYDNTFVARVKL